MKKTFFIFAICLGIFFTAQITEAAGNNYGGTCNCAKVKFTNGTEELNYSEDMPKSSCLPEFSDSTAARSGCTWVDFPEPDKPNPPSGGTETPSSTPSSTPKDTSPSSTPKSPSSTFDFGGTPTPPTMDQRCWFEEECIKYRQDFGMSVEESKKGGFYQGTDSERACNGKADASGKKRLGFCAPIGGAVTQIDFAGRKEFRDWGDFTQYIYKYLIMLAVALAVVMIVFGGFEWITSGGSAEKIGSAKKRIGGAMMGLLLALISYFLLDTLSPYLVNLRPPQAWLINPQLLVASSCEELKDNTGVYKFATNEEDVTPAIVDSRFSKATFSPKGAEGTTCGDKYFVEGAGKQYCEGETCTKEDELCQPSYLVKSAKKGSNIGALWQQSCLPGKLLISLSVNSWREELLNIPIAACKSDLVVAQLEKDWWDKQWIIYSICKNGSGLREGNNITFNTTGNNVGLYTRPVKNAGELTSYLIRLTKEEAFHNFENPYWCAGDNLVGFFFKSELKIKCNSAVDANFYVGCGDVNCDDVKAGTFCKDLTIDDYIPVEKIKSGLFLSAGLTSNIITTGVENKWKDIKKNCN